MNAQVIFYSALAFLLQLVASIPYGADLQRYSSEHQKRSSSESNFQTHPQRPYQKLGQGPYEGVYNNEQYINQQRLSNQYYANNYQKPKLSYENDNRKGAKEQINENQVVKVTYPEVSLEERNTHYRNYVQQVIDNNRFPQNVGNEVKEISRPAEELYHPLRPNPILNKNHNVSPHQENLPHQVPPKLLTNQLSVDTHTQHFPEILIKNTFTPSIPSVPPQNVHSSKDALIRVNDDYLQVDLVKERQIPVLPPPPIHVENGTPLNASERYLARAGNPVEQIPEPQTQQNPNPHYDSENYFSDPRIQNILSKTKQRKRYLVIHPNGVIEHVNNLEDVEKKHPNYILVKAGDIVPNTVNNKSVEKASSVPSPATPVQETNKTTNGNAVPVTKNAVPSLTFNPSSFELDVIVKPPTQVSEAVSATTLASLAPISAPVLVAPVTIAQTTVSKPVVAAAQAEAIASAPKATAIAPALNATANVTLPVATAIATAPNATANVTAPKATAIASAPHAIASASATTAPTPQIPPTLPLTPQAISTKSTPVITAHTPVQQAATITPTSQPKTATHVPLPQKTEPAPLETGTTAPSPTTPKKIQPSKIKIYKEVLPPNLHNGTDNAVKQPPIVPKTTSVVVAESSPKKLNESTSVPPAVPTDNPPQSTPQSSPSPISNNSQPLTPNVVKATSTSVPVTHPKTTVAVKIEDRPQEATTSDKSTNAPLVVPAPYNPDEFILDKAYKNVKPNPAEEVPDLGNLDVLANVPQKPVVWFRTSDPNFWQKLTDKNTGFDVVYFFQVQNEKKIVHDTKTTIFPNGTILEEFTETSFEFEGADPTVTKTTKLTNPEDL